MDCIETTTSPFASAVMARVWGAGRVPGLGEGRPNKVDEAAAPEEHCSVNVAATKGGALLKGRTAAGLLPGRPMDRTGLFSLERPSKFLIKLNIASNLSAASEKILAEISRWIVPRGRQVRV